MFCPQSKAESATDSSGAPIVVLNRFFKHAVADSFRYGQEISPIKYAHSETPGYDPNGTVPVKNLTSRRPDVRPEHFR